MLVGITIALASLLFIATAGLLYLRWATMREPTCVLIVEAPAALRGAEVTVDGINVLQAHKVVIGVGERFAIPFYLDYGRYSVRVAMNGVQFVDTEINLTHDRPGQRLDLSQFPPPPAWATTQPTTSSSARPFTLPDGMTAPPTLTPPGRGSRLSP
ncbi:MAG: hypothetical protein QOF78_821 [Phycisphaerales bacterium]|jgi:hypothetical protein|nr:hypothetical protein [Phycisphaerales bacterium]MEA2735144.1 hypothetical protein [Humisphaera sp.]